MTQSTLNATPLSNSRSAPVTIVNGKICIYIYNLFFYNNNLDKQQIPIIILEQKSKTFFS